LQRADTERVTLRGACPLSGLRPPGGGEFQFARAGGRVKGRTPALNNPGVRQPARPALRGAFVTPRVAGCLRHALRPADRPDAPSLARSVLSPTSCRLILASGCSSALRMPLVNPPPLISWFLSDTALSGGLKTKANFESYQRQCTSIKNKRRQF